MNISSAKALVDLKNVSWIQIQIQQETFAFGGSRYFRQYSLQTPPRPVIKTVYNFIA